MMQPAAPSTCTTTASMGPPSDNGGYDPVWWRQPDLVQVASMGPPSDNGGYARIRRMERLESLASMGPPSDNGGYGRSATSLHHLPTLQWVHRLITVVMGRTCG